MIGADVYRPARGERHPLVIWMHGGALIGGSRRTLPRHQLAAYLDAGIAVIAIDYRLAPETRLRSILGDVVDAHSWVLGMASQLGIDAGRIAVVGHSAGGYLALWAGAAVRPRPRAIVSFYGYADITASWYHTPSAYYLREGTILEADARAGLGASVRSFADDEGRWRFYRYCRQQGSWPREVAGDDLDMDPEDVPWLCPVRRVTAAYPPTLLLHGDRDTDVPFEASGQMAAALAAAGVEHRLIAVRGGDHEFDIDPTNPGNAARFGDVLSFLSQHLR